MTMIAKKKRMSPLNHSPEGLAYALRQSGLTQRQLAAEADISTSYLNEILKGKRSANQQILRQIAQVLNCPVVILESKIEAA